MDIPRFRRLPLLGILRGIKLADVSPLVEVVAAAGLEAIEITMNTSEAPALIRRTSVAAGQRIAVGAGTVLGVGDLEQALDAGATFIVMPILVPEVVERCAERGVPVFPGALTPQEVFQAWRAGATMVKVFPAGSLGPGHLREIKGPFADVELLACGGVNADNLAKYFASGASAVAFGASVFRSDWLAERRYERVAEEIRKLVAAYRSAVSPKTEPIRTG